jgi:exodeoxyribonuclease V gamma subunit
MLGDLLSNPLDDALAPEIVAVPTRGVERWLTQQLATRLGVTLGRADGVCANVEFPFPATLVRAAAAAASGIDPKRDPWAPNRVVWPLLDVVDECLGEPWLAPLQTHLENAAPKGEVRRFATVRHVADLYDRYAIHRPELLGAWGAGDAAAFDSLPPESRWQAELWRRLRVRISVANPAERLESACAVLRARPQIVDLPSRFSVFGLTQLPATYLDVLVSLGAGRDVHLFLLHPSPALWDRIADASPRPPKAMRRREDPTADWPKHPLLASWGHDSREMQLVLASVMGEHSDHHRPVAPAKATLLSRIQAGIREDRPPPGMSLPGREDSRALLEPADRSVQIHACHGRARQVEVLRDALLHLLAGDPAIEARDIIVMCPDIETYAPLIHSVFDTTDIDEEAAEAVESGRPDTAGAGATRPAGAGLQVQLADRSLRQTNPVLSVVARLLELSAMRLTASQVLDLAAREPVRQRFGLDDDDLARMSEWIVGAGIRWGLDGSHRSPFEMQALEANTWRAGLDRILLGATMADAGERNFGGVVPLDDVDSGDIELAGRVAELLDRLNVALSALNTTQPVLDWATVIGEAVACLTEVKSRDAWQAAQLQRILAELTDEASLNGIATGAALSPADMSALLADRLKGRPTRANFRTGRITVCTLVPMRSVPHKVVCLLGLDDGAFPRHTQRDGDDLIGTEPCVGDRDARSEDRQLLLDALLAATDHLVIAYTGRDERTNLERPPAVPLGELLDVIDRTVRVDGSDRARDAVVTHHPLQPFDPRNYLPGALVAGQPWRFDRTNLAGARALQLVPHEGPKFLAAPLPDFSTATIELDELERFVSHPVRGFLRIRLGIALGDRSHDIDDAMPVELDNLEQWAVGERLLAARLDGANLEDCLRSERARGNLPPGALAEQVLSEVVAGVEGLVAVAASETPPSSLDVNVRLTDGTGLVGTVSGLRGDLLHRVTYSRLGANHRLVSWVRLLALSAAWPDRSFEAVTIGRRRDGAARAVRVSTSRIALVRPGEDRRSLAERHLAVLVDLFRRGMREPLPLYCKTSAAWAEEQHNSDRGGTDRGGADPAAAAGKQWTDWQFPKEDRQPEHRLVLGGVVGFDELLADEPRRNETGDGWAEGEATRFGRYARRLWDGLLDNETMTNQ